MNDRQRSELSEAYERVAGLHYKHAQSSCKTKDPHQVYLHMKEHYAMMTRARRYYDAVLETDGKVSVKAY